MTSRLYQAESRMRYVLQNKSNDTNEDPFLALNSILTGKPNTHLQEQMLAFISTEIVEFSEYVERTVSDNSKGKELDALLAYKPPPVEFKKLSSAFKQQNEPIKYYTVYQEIPKPETDICTTEMKLYDEDYNLMHVRRILKNAPQSWDQLFYRFVLK